MSEDKINSHAPAAYSDDVVGKQKTLDELSEFVTLISKHEWAIVTLDDLQSHQWDEEGDVDYQDYYGGEIIKQADDGETSAIIIHNVWGLPVALALKNDDGSWQGIGVVDALREDVVAMLSEQDPS